MIWSPIFCNCSHEVTYNSVTDTYDVIRTINRCADHQNISTSTLGDTILTESRRQQWGRQELIDMFPAVLSDTGQPGGNLKEGITIFFTFTGTAPNRVVHIHYTGLTLTVNQLANAQTRLDNRFGAGRVIIDSN